MGFNDQEIVALSGAHALGRCHENASGYWGPWTYSETNFSNEYFRLLLDETWAVKKTHQGKPWTGPMQYETKDGAIMMLPSDLMLVQDPEFKKYVVMYKVRGERVYKGYRPYNLLLYCTAIYPTPYTLTHLYRTMKNSSKRTSPQPSPSCSSSA